MLKNMLTHLDFGPENQNLLIVISTISIYQNPPISTFQNFGGGGKNWLMVLLMGLLMGRQVSEDC